MTSVLAVQRVVDIAREFGTATDVLYEQIT